MAARRAAALLALGAAGAAGGRVPVVIDTDLGQDMDDTWAIAYLLASPEVDVRLIVTASRCTWGKATLLAKFLTDVGRDDIPIGIGEPTAPNTTARSWCNGTGTEQGCAGGFFVGPAMPYADGFSLSSYRGAVLSDGVSAMANELSKHESSWLVALAPMTNLAQLQARFPTAPSRAKLVAMAGSRHIGYEGTTPPDAEYNVAIDTAAAQKVFGAADEWQSFAIAPLDTCGKLELSGDQYAQVLQAAKEKTAPLASATVRMYDAWYESGCAHGDFCSLCSLWSPQCTPAVSSSILFDVQPAYMVAGGATSWASDFELEETPMVVNATGFTVASKEGGLVTVTTRWTTAGLRRFYASLTQRLTSHTIQIIRM